MAAVRRRGEARQSDEAVVLNTRGEPVDVPSVVDPRSLAIKVTNVTMQYPIGGSGRGSLKSLLFSLIGHQESRPKVQFVEVVRELNIDIRYGERVALIGHNGSGKSTLLRALAGVYPPKSGSIETVGHIGTLLDLGLGFEPEATGRENIYNRGMAMGYSRAQLRAAEKDIVEFARLGDFIDLPLRTYSSGMQLRLGFAVSTQFRPDILLIDEVFGVGDAAFADSAIERILEIVRGAGIMVIATHDINLVQTVCNRAIWLHRGTVQRDGPPGVVIAEYQKYMSGGG
jgi:lipopolysaccharide transport system ATP-binding protein